MTAEIAILNRHAVALAADSAATISSPSGVKVYNSVNKLFMLSKHAPVGIMVYGVAELTGVPWEVIVKAFREDLGARTYPTLREYADALINYINSHKLMFSEAQQRQQLKASVHRQFSHVRTLFEEDLAPQLESGPVADTDVRRILTAAVAKAYKWWMSGERLKGAPRGMAARITAKFQPDIDEVLGWVFGELPLTLASRRRLNEIAANVFTRQHFPEGISGVVVAGYGGDEYFPSLLTFDVEGIMLNFMKLREDEDRSATSMPDGTAAIVPFAQREMVDLFMSGIDPRLGDAVGSALQQFIEGLPDVIAKATGATGPQLDQLRESVMQDGLALHEAFFSQLSEQMTAQHVGPIMEAVQNLPKEELAAMAESLVSLTSFKRHVTHDVETVGGPIDVAVISKGDGFVWINRKHYFPGELNHHFFENYFRRGGDLGE